MNALRVISYNIRYDNPADGRNGWPQRKQPVVDLLHRYQPDLLGLQEVTHGQLTDLAAALPDYGWIGVGRDDGATRGGGICADLLPPHTVDLAKQRSLLALGNAGGGGQFWLGCGLCAGDDLGDLYRPA